MPSFLTIYFNHLFIFLTVRCLEKFRLGDQWNEISLDLEIQGLGQFHGISVKSKV